MSKVRSFFLQSFFGKRFLYLIVLVVFVGLSSIAFSVHSQIAEQIAGSEVTQATAISDENQSKVEQPNKSCCGGQALAAGEFYTLLGTYYSLKDNQTSVLMFNNKAPQPLTVNAVFFSMSGERLELPALTIAAASYQEFDLRELLANAGKRFREGSVQVRHQGMKLQLGVQVKILKLERGLIFDEQFVQTSKFVSSHLESVWWLPSPQSKTSLIVSNTTDSPVTTTIKADGTAPQQIEPVTIQLNAHQTRVLDILQDLARQPKGAIHKEGGVSISHSGTPGAVLARMFVSEESTGFSTIVNFIDPQATASSKWNGSGYRIGKIAGEDLTPILVARNVGSEPSVVSGRLSYTNDAGEVVFVNVPAVKVAASATKLIDVKDAIKQSNIPANITDTGFEFEYSTPKGTVVMTALSVSRSGNQVFQVPLFDPNKMGSSAGGYPWKATGDYKTILYIKNETDQPQKYTASLLYEGGDYTLGIKDIKPHQLVAIDFRALRDNQTADINGHIIPLNVERGQIGWSSKGKTNRALSGRSHQSSISEGVSSTYDCRNCCPNSIYAGWITPGEVRNEIGDIANFTANQQDMNCYGQRYPPQYADIVYWESADPSIASTYYYNGQTTSLDVGDTIVQASWTADSWFDDGSYRCDYIPIQMTEQSYINVQPRCAVPTNFHQVGQGTDVGNGRLRFLYAWESSSGNLADLSACTVGEIVTYPGSSPYTFPSPPFPNVTVPNPTITGRPGNEGQFQDNHSTPGSFVKPYSAASFTATQYYRYSCPCKNGGAFVNLVGPIDIIRSVSRVGFSTPDYKFTITKSGSSATINPLP